MRSIRALRNEDIPLGETQGNGYGNSKVLAPKFRRSDQARLVGRWLTDKATERMRRDDSARSVSRSTSVFRQTAIGRNHIR